jgi:hypothetical protein
VSIVVDKYVWQGVNLVGLGVKEARAWKNSLPLEILHPRKATDKLTEVGANRDGYITKLNEH